MRIFIALGEAVAKGVALFKTVTGNTGNAVTDNSKNFLRIKPNGPQCGNVSWERKFKIYNAHSEKTINVVLLEITTSRGPLSKPKVTKRKLQPFFLRSREPRLLACNQRKYPGGNVTKVEYKIISSKFVGSPGTQPGNGNTPNQSNVYTIPDDTDNVEVLFDVSKDRTVSLHEFYSAHTDVYVIVEVQGNVNKRAILNSKNTSAIMRGTRYLISVGEAAPNKSVQVKIE